MDWEFERLRFTESLSFQLDLYPWSLNNWGESVSSGICSIPGAIGVPTTGSASRVGAHMGLLSLAHPMLGQDALQIPDGNVVAVPNDFS